MAKCTCPMCQGENQKHTYDEGQVIQCRSCKKPFSVTFVPATHAAPHPHEPDDGRRIEQFNAVESLIRIVGLHMSGCPGGTQRTDIGRKRCKCGMRQAMSWYLKLVPIGLATR